MPQATDAGLRHFLDDVRSHITSSKKLCIVGGQSKTRFLHTPDSITISSKSFQGVVAYDPQEFVITVLAGTPIAEVIQLVSSHGQYLPFDPLLPERGATVGGTIAANASGPGRFRFGGVRDFLLGVRFLDGRGISIRGGGQVVKNAAGFDYPKLLVGSDGQLGFIYEATFKVFPRPERFATLIATFDALPEAIDQMNRIACSQFDVETLDLVPGNQGEIYELAIRIGGLPESIEPRLERIQRGLSRKRVLWNSEDVRYWNDVTNFVWAQNAPIVKCPITVARIARLEHEFCNHAVHRRYSIGGNVLWWELCPNQPEMNRAILNIAPGKFFIGPSRQEPRSPFHSGPFGQAIKKALDPESKFT